jgi:HEAT repeat protein
MSCTLLSDDNLLVRKAAADALSRMHDTSVLTALRASAVLETDPGLQKTTRSILMGLRKKIAVLVKQLGATDATQRILAARALGQAVYPGGVPALKTAMKDKDKRVRVAVVKALSNFDSKEADQALRLMGADAAPEIRKLVDTHFKKRERLKQWRKFYKDPNRLVMKTTDKDPIWRADASIALGIAGAETAVTNLIRLLIKDKDESVRLAAAWALVLMASGDSERALRMSAKDDKSEKVRLTARKYLIIEKVSVDDLLPQLRVEDASARQDAAEALSLLANSKVAPHLIRTTMCDKSPAVRAAALRGLARVGNAWTRQVAKTSSLRDKDKKVRRSAMVMYILAGGK